LDNTFVVGVDHNMEDMLPWWFNNVRTHHPKIDITIADFGMSKTSKKWCEKNADTVMTYDRHPKLAWFYKPQVLLEAPYEYKCWLDIDCQVLCPVPEIFDFPTDEKIALTHDHVRGNPNHDAGVFWWATGVNVAKGKPKILKDWAYHTLHSDQRGDQEVLHQMIKMNRKYNDMIIKMPLEYQWLRIDLFNGYDSPNKKIIHWTGPVGKAHIRENLMR